MLGARVGSGRKLIWGWNSGLYARSGSLAEPRLPSSCGDCSLAAGTPAPTTTTSPCCAMAGRGGLIQSSYDNNLCFSSLHTETKRHFFIQQQHRSLQTAWSCLDVQQRHSPQTTRPPFQTGTAYTNNDVVCKHTAACCSTNNKHPTQEACAMYALQVHATPLTSTWLACFFAIDETYNALLACSSVCLDLAITCSKTEKYSQ